MVVWARKTSAGFTLIEVLVVIVILGFMASLVQINRLGNDPVDRLAKESERFYAVFNLAADFALLNNQELGLVVDETSYHFLAFDGQSWQEIADNNALAKYELPEGILARIELEDLPIEDPGLIDTLVEANNDDDKLFEGTNIGCDEQQGQAEGGVEQRLAEEQGGESTNDDQEERCQAEQKPKFPQVYLLPGGEISPFRVEFSFDDMVEATDELSFQVSGLYSTPLTIAGPLYSGEPK